MRSIIKGILLSLSILIFIIGLIFSNLNIILSSIFLILIHNFYYSFEKIKERIIFFTFNITITIFLMGRIIVNVVFDYKDNINSIFSLNFYDSVIISHILICLFLCYFFIYIGYVIIESFNKEDKKNSIKKKRSGYWDYVKTISKYFFYFCFVFRIIYLNDIASFVDNNGYYEFYISYSSNLPRLFILFSSFYDVAFFSFLAMQPRKKEALFPIILYIVEGGVSLSTGQRADFLLNIVIIFVYFCLRDLDKDNKRKWLGRKELFIGSLALPFTLILMTYLGNLRSRSQSVTNNAFESILEFFYSQGVSANVIGYAKLFEHSIPDNRFYSFGPLIQFIKINILSKFIDTPIYIGQTVERALYGNSFPHTISYLVMPEVYVTGSGYGSSFIAEFYVDFGYLGVILGSFFYGIIIYLLFKGFQGNPIVKIFILLMIRQIFFAPRSEAISFFTVAFSNSNIMGLIFIFIIAYLIRALDNQKNKFNRNTLLSYKEK